MLTELKRCNKIGNVEGVLFLANMLSDNSYLYKDEIVNRCALEKNISINCSGAVAFFEYLGYVEIDGEKVIPTVKLNALNNSNSTEIVQKMVKSCIEALTNDGIFDAGSICFDTATGQLGIKKSAFPLAYASIRNFLITVGALEQESNNEICISGCYETDFVALVKSRRKQMSLDELLKKQEEQNKRGAIAEEFVLKLEKRKLQEKASRIKRVSDIDVSAGYDIVSFENNNSVAYDKFIEVKCYLGTPHFFWSENECDVAKLKGDKYYLCLVDYNKINLPGYEPDYIRNPYDVLFEDDNWLVSTSSYKIQRI